MTGDHYSAECMVNPFWCEASHDKTFTHFSETCPVQDNYLTNDLFIGNHSVWEDDFSGPCSPDKAGCFSAHMLACVVHVKPRSNRCNMLHATLLDHVATCWAGLAKQTQHCATWWPNARNMLHATVLHDVAPTFSYITHILLTLVCWQLMCLGVWLATLLTIWQVCVITQ